MPDVSDEKGRLTMGKRISIQQLKASFGETLARTRHEQGVSLIGLSQMAHLPAMRINAYEAGTLIPDLEDLYALAGGLDVHPAELLPVMERADDRDEVPAGRDTPALSEDEDEESEEDDEDEEEDEYPQGRQFVDEG